LAGLKVVDLTRVLGGPYCTMILADHGADVLKIEPPQGDETREWGPPFLKDGDDRGDASYYIGVNRNKRALALDLTRAEGRSVLLRMLADADVLVDNFKPGTMERWGLGYHDVLAARFPRLVHCRISGFGEAGPLGGLPGYDAIVQAMTGLMSVNGDSTTGPMRMGTPIVDLATGMYAVIGIMMALQERTRSGLGQYVDMTLHDCALAMLHPHAANYFLNGRRPAQSGNSHPNIVPCDKFSTQTNEIFLAIGNDAQFRKLAREIGRADIAEEPRFASNASRLAHKTELTQLLAASFARVDGQAVAVRLLGEGLPVAPVMGVDEALNSGQAAARAMVLTDGAYRGLVTPIKLSRTPGGFRCPPPRFAQHSDEILREHGFDDAEIDALGAAGATPRTRK
jgi:formyl-CoA transferase